VNGPDVTLLIGTYNRPQHLRLLLNALLLQTHGGWRALVLDDGEEPGAGYLKRPTPALRVVHEIGDARIEWQASGPFRNDWHYASRIKALQQVQTPWVGFLSDDAYYCPRWLEMMLGYGQRHEVSLVYCDWIYDRAGYVLYSGQPRTSFIDIGGFLVQTAVARAVGFPDIGNEADGHFVEAVVRAGHPHVRVPHVLYVKN